MAVALAQPQGRRPWLPMIAIIMVAAKFGTGRGTLFEILTLTVRRDYVWPCSFGELTGARPRHALTRIWLTPCSRLVNEAIDEDGHQQSRRRLAYEALKNAIDPAPTALRRYEAKGQHAFSQISAMSVIIATQHRDVIKLPRDDRRFCVISGGDRMAIADVEIIRAWMADPNNIGALYRALLEAPAVPTTLFNPFDEPPPFKGRLEMIGMGETRLEDAYGAAVEALERIRAVHDHADATADRLLRSLHGPITTSAWADKSRYMVAKNAHRLRERNEPYNRITYRGKQEVLYARTVDDQLRWRDADKELIVAQLDRTEKRVVRIVSLDVDDLADLARAIEAGSVQGNNDDIEDDDGADGVA